MRCNPAPEGCPNLLVGSTVLRDTRCTSQEPVGLATVEKARKTTPRLYDAAGKVVSIRSCRNAPPAYCHQMAPGDARGAGFTV
jgi:hypothetical protein